MASKINESLKKRIKKSLIEQLKENNKVGEHFENLVDDYIYYWELKEKLQADIKEYGIRFDTFNGNGIKVTKANESVQNLGKVTVSMLKILADLGLQEVVVKKPVKESNGYY